MPKVMKSDPSEIETASSNYQYYQDGGCVKSGNIIVVAAQQDVVSNYAHSMEGWTTPNWKRLQNEGHILPMTPFQHFQYQSHHNGDGGFDVCWVSPWRRYVKDPDTYAGQAGWWGGLSSSGVLDPGELLSKVGEPDPAFYVQKAAARIAGSGWDALTFLAEFKQMRRMFENISTKMDNLTRGQSPGRIHDLWLEARYGWRTLSYDIRDLHEVVTQWDQKRTRYNQKSGNTYVTSWSDDDVHVNGNMTFGRTEEISATVNLRGTVVADIEVPKFRINPVATYWEVTKLSFVVDWLINVGQALDATEFLLRAKDYQSAGGYRIDFDTTGSMYPIDAANGATIHKYSGSYSGNGYLEKRIPMPVSSIPRLKLRLNKWKVIDLLSLVIQRL